MKNATGVRSRSMAFGFGACGVLGAAARMRAASVRHVAAQYRWPELRAMKTSPQSSLAQVRPVSSARREMR